MSTAKLLFVCGLLKETSDKDIEIQRHIFFLIQNRCPSSVLFSPTLSLSQLFILFGILAKEKMNSDFQHCA